MEISNLRLQIADFQHVRVLGLMTMATNTDDEAEIRRCFRLTASIARDLTAEGGLTSNSAAVERHHFQFLKQGYFVVDDDSTPEHLVFNRTASLKDNWQK